MQPTTRRSGFGAELRLRSKLQFDAIYAGGRRIDDSLSSVCACKPNGLSASSCGHLPSR